MTMELLKPFKKAYDNYLIFVFKYIYRSSRGRGTPSPYQRGRRNIRGRPQPIVWQDQGELIESITFKSLFFFFLNLPRQIKFN